MVKQFPDRIRQGRGDQRSHRRSPRYCNAICRRGRRGRENRYRAPTPGPLSERNRRRLTEEVLIAISELAAEEFAAVVKVPSVY